MKRAKAIDARRQAAVSDRAGLLKNVEETAPLKIAQLLFYKDTLVTLKDVAVRRGGRTVCENVGFTVKRGERVALTGRNGAGKSSILKLVCGEDIPHTGTAETAGRLLVSRVAQDTSGLCGSLSDFARAHGLEQSLFLAILRKLDFSRAQFEKDLRDFSGGQKKSAHRQKPVRKSAPAGVGRAAEFYRHLLAHAD